MINLTTKERNDLDDVYDCLLANNKFDFALDSFYKVGKLIIKRCRKVFFRI